MFPLSPLLRLLVLCGLLWTSAVGVCAVVWLALGGGLSGLAISGGVGTIVAATLILLLLTDSQAAISDHGGEPGR